MKDVGIGGPADSIDALTRCRTRSLVRGRPLTVPGAAVVAISV